jgi:hypothetical protein
MSKKLRKIEIAVGVINMVTKYFNMDVSVILKPIKELAKEEAYCVDIGGGFYEVEISPELLINCSEEVLVETIAHEMVHIKQYEVDGLDLQAKAHYYKGEWFDPEQDYWFTPWEIEARGYERAFLAMWNMDWSKFS